MIVKSKYLLALPTLALAVAVSAAPTNLTPELSKYADVFFAPGLQLDQSGKNIFYVADQNERLYQELFTVPVDGGEAKVLSAKLEGNDDVMAQFVKLTPDSSHAVYIINRSTSTDPKIEVYSTPAAGGDTVLLNPSLGEGGAVAPEMYTLTSDSRFAVFRATQSAGSSIGLYASSITTGQAKQLTNASIGNVGQASILDVPSAGKVVFLAETDGGKGLDLYIVPTDASSAPKKLVNLSSGSSVLYNSVHVAPDGKSVIFVADMDESGKNELYAVSSSGGEAKKISGALPSQGDVLSASLEFSADGKSVYYLADADQDNRYDLHRASLTGGAPELLVSPPEGYTLALGSVLEAPDGSALIYRVREKKAASQDGEMDLSTPSEEIFLYNVADKSNAKLNQPLAKGGTVIGGDFMPDSKSVFFIAQGDGSNQLFVHDIASAETKLAYENTDTLSLSAVSAKPTPDSRNLVFLAKVEKYKEPKADKEGGNEAEEERMEDIQRKGVTNLYVVPTAGGVPTPLNDALPKYSRVYTALVTPDSSRVVFTARTAEKDRVQLFTAPIETQ